MNYHGPLNRLTAFVALNFLHLLRLGLGIDKSNRHRENREKMSYLEYGQFRKEPPSYKRVKKQ